jgi:3'-phosphoadenosine 5'-phosphosulfate sulfotransferase (PAPS reductase)/FAD synthetase
MARKLHYRTTFQGLPISIENRKGSVRHWTDRNGMKGKTKMLMPYGYVRGVLGADGDQLDVFIGPNKHSRTVFVVNQRAAHIDARKFDEHKTLLGFDSLADAKDAYLKHFDSPKFLGSITEMTIERFKRWISDGKKKTGPVHKAYRLHSLAKAGPYIGPRGGKWADPKHTRPWKPEQPRQLSLFVPAKPQPKRTLNVIQNDPALTQAQKAQPPSEALKAIFDKPASDPRQWHLPAGARVNDPWQPKTAPADQPWSHPDYGKGTGAAPWHKSEDWTPDLHSYDYIVVNSSAGKDSQAMLSHVVEQADKARYPRDKIVVVHADLGRAEWEGTKNLAREQAEHYGLRFEVVQREQNDLIEQIEERHGDLAQKDADVGKLLEAGVATWRDLATAKPSQILEIIGEGKGSSKWDGKRRAADLIRNATRKRNVAAKTHEKRVKAANAAVDKAARSVADAKSDKAKQSADKRLERALARTRELAGKGDPWDWPVDFGKAIAWPSADARYCTSDHKRVQVQKLVTSLAGEAKRKGRPAKILNTLGIRAQESASREAMDNFQREKATSNQVVDRWYPIHRWHEQKVWSKIEQSKVPYHKAYDLGMRRLSCVFCVFATKEDLMVAASHNPSLFKTYLELEEKVGSSFQPQHSLSDVRDEIQRRRDEGYELNELAEWAKKALSLDSDTALVKAELQTEPTAVGLILQAAHQRLERNAQTPVALALEWKPNGLCVHLDTATDSHHVEYLSYPAAYNASMVASAYAQKHGLEVEEHNPPGPVPRMRMLQTLRDIDAGADRNTLHAGAIESLLRRGLVEEHEQPSGRHKLAITESGKAQLKTGGSLGKVVAKHEIKPHPALGMYDRTYHEVDIGDGKVSLSQHADGKYGMVMPKASVKHLKNDLAGKVDLPKSGHLDIDAVIEGKAELLGKGDDGLAFKVGNKVVKVSTTVPYQPDNPGHRSPEQAKEMIRAQVVIGNHLADQVQGIQRSTFVAHGDKGFQIKPYVRIPDKWGPGQLETIQDILIDMHKAGYSLNDEVQVGIDPSGDIVMFDVGKAARTPEGRGDPNDRDSDPSIDMEALKRLYDKSGVPFVRRDVNEGMRDWARVEGRLPFWKKQPKSQKMAQRMITNAANKRRAYVRATLSGKELEVELMVIEFDEHDALLDVGINKPLSKAMGHHDQLYAVTSLEELRKGIARGGKYIRRVPYRDSKTGKMKYRYYYRESAIARGAKVGELVRFGQKLVEVLGIEDGRVTLKSNGRTWTVGPEQWANTAAKHYGRQYHEWAERRARQTINAVLRHVPRELLVDLKGKTDEQRLAELKKRVPAVYARLRAAFQRAGVTPGQARETLTRALERRGWQPESRALVVGTVLEHRKAPIRQIIQAAENLAEGAVVEPGHVASVLELAPPKQVEKLPEQISTLAQSAERELAALSEALSRAHKGDDAASAHALAQALSSPAVQKLVLMAKAFPGVADKAVEPAREAMLEVAAVAPHKAPTTEGAETLVYVAGENGQPKGLKARYKLVESHEVIASHDPSSFKRHEKYPADVQERAYHRDKAEQGKVIRNAQKMNAAFLVNSNPDAVNGPPMMTEAGIVLGGNSRAMSMQRAYSDHPESAEKYKAYLRDHAHEVGLRPEDVAAMKKPVLVRVVEPEDSSKQSLQLLVRQMNESFTQGMDPRTMQVAMGRKLSEDTLRAIGENMEEDEALSTFLASSRSEPFVNALFRAGVIDQRNANQYLKKGTRQLNSDGRTLVSRVLVGRLVGDADLLSETRPRIMDNLARVVPALMAAKSYGAGYDLSKDMATALSAYNDLTYRVETGAIPPLEPKMTPKRFDGLFNYFQSLFGDTHEVVSNKRARQLLEVLIRKPGSTQISRVFKDYAQRASQHPEGQASMFGAGMSPDQVLTETVDAALGKRAEPKPEPPPLPLEPEPPRPPPPTAQSAMFASLDRRPYRLHPMSTLRKGKPHA